ncbi:PspA/IM30 family protein [Haliangium sp.]|uniref:PspA/IM30 family protein n=1 Tax=Haliangium sp. TaxID=2663208 RepID=UPI003D106EF3
MGIFSRMKNGVRAKANSAIDNARDPAKELNLAIQELEDIRKKALQELVSYKATAKQMDQDIERHQNRMAEWEKRAMAAVRSGEDDLAKQALREQKQCQTEIERAKRDRDQAASYAVQLNKSRKEAETKLRMLKLRQGTLATKLKAAQTGSQLGFDNSLFDKLDDAEARIDQQSIEAEVAMSLDDELGGGVSEDEFDRKLIEAGGDPGTAHGGDDPLEALKAKMAADKARKKLPGGTPEQ